MIAAIIIIGRNKCDFTYYTFMGKESKIALVILNNLFIESHFHFIKLMTELKPSAGAMPSLVDTNSGHT